MGGGAGNGGGASAGAQRGSSWAVKAAALVDCMSMRGRQIVTSRPAIRPWMALGDCRQ